MEEIKIIFKVILHGIWGYYLLRWIVKENSQVFCRGLFVPSIGIFSLLSLIAPMNTVGMNFIFGIIGGELLKTGLYLLGFSKPVLADNRLSFGILNVFNIYIANPLFDWVISSSNVKVIVFLLFFSAILVICDISISLRIQIEEFS